MRRLTFILFITSALSISILSAQNSADSSFVKEVKVAKTFALSEIDESTTDEDADIAGQNFSTLATLSNDPFLSKVGYNLSGFRFSPRGIKNKYSQTLINGIEFNSQIRGNFNYSMIGGMNDVTRNSTVGEYMTSSLYTFGDIGGSQDYNIRSGSYANGTKITLTGTNRNYYSRLMLSHHTGMNRKGWAFSALIGARYAHEGAVKGTFYNNLSYFLGVEKQWDNGRHSLSISTFGSPVQRAQSSATVQEAYDIMDNTAYNSYWGYMPDGKTKRNQRVVSAFDPTLVLSHVWKPNRNLKLSTGLGIHYNRYGSTALSWFGNAADPRPDYYRQLPSYTANGLPTADYNEHARYWRDNKSQIDWTSIYDANYYNSLYGANKSALYIVEERRNDALEASLSSTLEYKINEDIRFTSGINLRQTVGHTFDVVADLLGAEYHLDVDKYGERDFGGNEDIKQNDLRNPNRIVKEGDVFGYEYKLPVTTANIWAQNHHNYKVIEFFYALKINYTSFYRLGMMENGRTQIPNVDWTSYGKGKVHNYLDYAIKTGVVFKINGRNLLSLNEMFKTQAPLPYDAYMAPRIIDEYLPGLNDKWYPNKNSTMVYAFDLNYVFSYPKINGRVSVFYDEYLNDLQQTAYYNDSYGTFVHHNIVGVNKRNYGAEVGVSYNVWKNLTLSLAGTWMNYRYTNSPMGYIRTENGYMEAGYPENEFVGIKNFHVGGSPEIVGTFGVQYFWNYFWFEANVNVAGSNYLDPSYIQRTNHIISSLKAACDAAGLSTAEKAKTLQSYTGQNRLDDWSKAAWKNNTMPLTLDLSVSKLFYFKGGKQLNINLSLVNVTNNTGIKTGGFEQGRIPTKISQGITSFDYDNINKFPAKYYFMQGFNFFLNVGFKF